MTIALQSLLVTSLSSVVYNIIYDDSIYSILLHKGRASPGVSIMCSTQELNSCSKKSVNSTYVLMSGKSLYMKTANQQLKATSVFVCPRLF